MDAKVEIKEEEDPLNVAASQREREFFLENSTTRTNADAVLLDDGCNLVKTEIKSETTLPEFCSQREEESFTKHPVKQIKFETVICSNNSEINIKTEVEEQTQNEREILPHDSVMKLKCNSNNEIDNQVAIKEEPWWLETETSSGYDDNRDGDVSPVKSPRFYNEAVSSDSSGRSLLSTAEVSGKTISLYNGKSLPDKRPHQENDIEVATVEHVHSEQSGTRSGEKSFTQVSHCDNRETVLEEKSLYWCNSCNQSFADLSHFKTHSSIRVGKKLHQCKTCHKTFISLSKLETHTLIHEGKKPHKCNTCDKSFTQLSNLKRHNLVHEGIKPYKCKICGRSFTQSGSLKVHNLVHEREKPYRCETCDESFIQLSHLEKHNMIHEGKRPHKCNTCGKSFTQLSHLKRHVLIHEGKKPHKCETCDKCFTHLSYLKMHNLIHEGKKPYKCKTCDKRFTRLAHLQKHNMIHSRAIKM